MLGRHVTGSLDEGTVEPIAGTLARRLLAVRAQVDVDALVAQYGVWFVRVAVFVGTLLAVYLLGRFVVLPPVSRVIRARNERNPTLVEAIEQYLKVSFVVAGLPVATAAAGFGGVVAGSAVVVAALTLALGVAGQDVIGNLVSGIFLVADPDFNVGDYIEWDDRAGTVRTIDLRVTRVRTPAGEVVTVPNTELATTAVRNPYQEDRYRVTQRLTVGYEEDVAELTELLVAVAREDDRVLDDPEPAVHVTDLGGSAVELAVRYWVGEPKTTDLATLRTDVATSAKDRLLAAGVTVAPASQQALSGDVDVRLDPEEPRPSA